MHSEPEFLISYLDRHDDWAVVICLVGGGQEINTGEAGIGAWIDAVRDTFVGWDVFISPELNDTEYAAGHALESLGTGDRVKFDRDLHLDNVQVLQQIHSGDVLCSYAVTASASL